MLLAHTTTRDKKGVFGNKLRNVVEEEIARSKLYNDANKEKRRFFISNPPNQSQRYSPGRILGLQNKLKRHDYPSSKEKDKPNKTRLQYISEKAETASNSKCSVPSKAKIMRINKIEEQSDKRKRLEHFLDIINKSFKTTKMVGNLFREQKECINKWSVEQQGTKTLYQHPRNEISLDQFGQLDVYSLPQPTRRCGLTRNQCNSGINMGNVPSNEDQTESPTLTGYGQCDGRLCVMTEVQQTQLDDESQNIQYNSQVIETIQISSNIRAWTVWCTEHTKDPIRCPLEDIIQFFTTKTNERKSYNTIAVYRSAISIFRSNLSAELGDDIYDITPSLDFIVSLGDNSRLPLIALTKKIAFLYTLLSTSQSSDLAKLDLTMLTNTQNSITIQCINPKEINIAIATSLCHYLDRTQNPWFTNEQRAAMFLSCVGLHRPASIDSIANWLKDIIRKLAPDGKAKDLRVLLAMLAQNGSADLNLILALGNWSSLNTY
ncbi:11080_t:CDS:2 [Gigaspora margarita]|uniref:11080_t:CDS:1 n=1 Tax=Gigaspora margarita TaxID=4874 RepID=A0ABN7VSS8_GIGMA|nr:11080_t:CDS:2 [Gigaspora margarita]